MEQFNRNVSSNYVYKREDDFCGFIVQHDRRGVEDASYPFGFFWLENKQTGEKWMKDFYVGEENGLHDDIENELMSSWAEEHRMLPQMAEKIMRIGYGLRGRIWVNDKVIAFDQNKISIPDKNKMKYILHELEMETDETFDDYTYYVSDCEDPNSKTKDWKLVNAYSIREFLTGIADGEKAVDSVNKRNISDFVRDKYAGEKAYQDFQANDPRADRMYKDFVAEHKNRKNMKTLILNERQSKLLRINECIDDILNEMMAPQNKPTIVTYGGAKCYVCPKTSFEKAAVAAQKAGCKYFRFEGQGENVAYSTAQNLPKNVSTTSTSAISPTGTTDKLPAVSKPAAQNTVSQQNINNLKPQSLDISAYRIRTYLKNNYVLFPVDVLDDYIVQFKADHNVTLGRKTAAIYLGIDNNVNYVGIDNGGDVNTAVICNVTDKYRASKATNEKLASDGKCSIEIIDKGVKMVQKLTAKGLNQKFAIGIVGNMCYESGCNPLADKIYPDAHPEGLCQWVGGRKTSFIKWANKNYSMYTWTKVAETNVPVDKLTDIQLEYLLLELQSDSTASKYYKIWNSGKSAKGTTDVADIAAEFEAKFERPGEGKETGSEERQHYAQFIALKLGLSNQ